MFEGVDPNSDEAHQLAKAFGPTIRAFYHKAAQNHALGSVDQSRSRRQFGEGLSMSYTNQHGMETVRVKVAPERAPKPKPRGRRLPDWVVVEFEVDSSVLALPNSVDDPQSLYSVYVLADVKGFNETPDLPNNRGSAFWTNPSITTDARCAFAGSTSTPAAVVEATFSGDVYRVSLRLDLRPYHVPEGVPAPPMLVDIYALKEVARYEQIGWTNVFDDNLPTGETHPALLNGVPTIAGDWDAWGTAGYAYTYTRWFDPDTDEEVDPLTGALPGAMTRFAPIEGPALDPFYSTVTGPETTPDPGRRVNWYSTITYDGATGLATQVSKMYLSVSDDETSEALSGPSTDFYVINPVYDLRIHIDDTPALVRGTIFYGTPPWAVGVREIDPTVGAMQAEFRWHPRDVETTAFNIGLIHPAPVPWPKPREYREGGEPGPGQPGTKFGTVIIDLEKGGLVFNPATV